MSNSSGYAIICDARGGQRLGIRILALVDRSRSKRLWWVSDDTMIMVNYRSKVAADYVCSRLLKNNPRVVPFDIARDMIKAQISAICEAEAENDGEGLGWDAHKGY